MNIKQLMQQMDYGPAPEATELAESWLARRADQGFGHFINGEFVYPSTAEYLPVINPARSKIIGKISKATSVDVGQAVVAARAAAPSWASLGGHRRARYLYALARHVQKHARLFAVLESINNGKPIRESRDIDIPLVARHFYHHAGWAELLETEFPNAQALGVCGQIIPWNFPLLMLAWKIAPALAAGNTVVLKPAEYTPVTAMLFAELCQSVGLPAGVVNIVNGDGDTGAHLVEHPDIDKLAFTGSTEVGQLIRRASAGSGKKLTLELGGKSPFIVFADCDMDAAIEGVVDAVWFNQGEVCCAGSRILVQESAYAAFSAKLQKRLQTMRVGDPLDKSTDVGAIVHPQQVQRIKAMLQQAQCDGGQLQQADTELPADGCFIAPGFISEIGSDASAYQEEIFGPIATLLSFRTPVEALELANNTRYGLSASIWSENINLALDIAAQVKAGVVWINCTNLFDAAAGFGGYRMSGFGREGGREGMYEYLRCELKLLANAKAETDFNPPAQPPAATSDSAIDRSAKLYIGGKQVRPDSGYSYAVSSADGKQQELAALGNRKDIRNAVEAAHKAAAWSQASGHQRAQVLYFIAENLACRSSEFARRLRLYSGCSAAAAERELDCVQRRIFYYAAQADKYDGRVHRTLGRHITLAMPEAYGVMGIVCPQSSPLLAFVSLLLPAIALGNRVVIVPSETLPLLATDLYQVLETSDVPAGVINIVTGARSALVPTLAAHDDLAALWYFGSLAGGKQVEELSAGNLKATWVENGQSIDWHDHNQGQHFLRHASQIKNIWAPYGE